MLKTLGATQRRSTPYGRELLAPRTIDRITPKQMRDLDARIDRALAAAIKLRDDILKVGRT